VTCRPPTPQLANYAPGTHTLAVAWSTALSPGPLSHANWTMRFNNTAYTFTGAIAAGKLTQAMGATAGAIDFGPNVCNYAAAPPDVISTAGVPAAPFTAFPIF